MEEAVGSAAQDDVRRSGLDSRIHPDHAAADFPEGQHHTEHSARISGARSARAAPIDQGRFPRAPDLRVDRRRSGARARALSADAGFVQKLMDRPITDTTATPRISGLFIDVDRSKALWNDVYRAPQSLIKEGDWIDRASFGIPYTYAFTGAILAEAMNARGDAKSANAIKARVRAIVKAARIEGFPPI